MERVIIDLQSRVMELTDKVDSLSKEVNSLKKGQEQPTEKQASSSSGSKIKGSISKNQLVEQIKGALRDQIPEDKILKGSRKEGSGVVILTKGDKIKLCIRGSGHYRQVDVSERMKYTGFSTLSKKTIENTNGQLKYDFFVFAVNTSESSANPKIDFFIFDRQQLSDLLRIKTPSGKNDTYYFYFGQTVDGHYIDDRERDKEVLVDEEHNNWDEVVNKYKHNGK